MKSQELKVTSENFVTHFLNDNSYYCNVGGSYIKIFPSSDDDWLYQSATKRLIDRGSVFARIEELNFGLLKASNCIHDGGRGDEDGYGVEPDTWIVAYLNSEMEFVSPFALEDSHINRNISNLLEANINPFNEDGSVKICPFDKVERDYRITDCFKILQGKDWGFANSQLEVIIPPAFKIIYGDQNGMVCFRQHNNLCGLLNLQNEIVIPALYDYLTFIEEDEFLGCYIAIMNGKKIILNAKNELIKDLK